MQEVRKLLEKGKLSEANRLLEEKMSGRWSEGYLPMANLHLITGMGDDIRNCIAKEQTELQKIERYCRRLSLDTAIETVEWETDQLLFKREYFVSKPQDELYIFVVYRIKTSRMKQAWIYDSNRVTLIIRIYRV